MGSSGSWRIYRPGSPRALYTSTVRWLLLTRSGTNRVVSCLYWRSGGLVATSSGNRIDSRRRRELTCLQHFRSTLMNARGYRMGRSTLSRCCLGRRGKCRMSGRCRRWNADGGWCSGRGGGWGRHWRSSEHSAGLGITMQRQIFDP